MNDLENIINNSSNYTADGIGSYKVDNVTYKDYGNYTFFWEKTYVKSPERSGNGSLGNLDTYATFITPHLTVTYDIMTITDYRSIIKQYLSKNQFTVTCYDPINNEMTTNTMYFATPSAPTYYYRTENDKNVEILGVRNYTVELIGTNNDIADTATTYVVNVMNEDNEGNEANQVNAVSNMSYMEDNNKSNQ